MSNFYLLLKKTYFYTTYINSYNVDILFTGTEGVTTVAVKTIKENATEVEKKDLLSELEVCFYFIFN